MKSAINPKKTSNITMFVGVSPPFSYSKIASTRAAPPRSRDPRYKALEGTRHISEVGHSSTNQ